MKHRKEKKNYIFAANYAIDVCSLMPETILKFFSPITRLERRMPQYPLQQTPRSSNLSHAFNGSHTG
jgi:hypothetical protein